MCPYPILLNLSLVKTGIIILEYAHAHQGGKTSIDEKTGNSIYSIYRLWLTDECSGCNPVNEFSDLVVSVRFNPCILSLASDT